VYRIPHINPATAKYSSQGVSILSYIKYLIELVKDSYARA
jgi:hypothetical protein